jgi:uncharacterized membrane protein
VACGSEIYDAPFDAPKMVTLILTSQFCERLSQTPLSIALRDDPYPYPVLLTIHVISIALFGGMVVMGNLRVLGFAMRGECVSELMDQFRPWKWIGFAILTVTGGFLTLSDPVEYCGNIMYWVSLALLLLVGINAWIFRFGVYRTVADWEESAVAPVPARRWAAISLTLWILIVFAGRAIAFF